MATKLMTANEALAGMTAKLEAKGLPPGLIQAILDAMMNLFKSFCPALAPAPAALKDLVSNGHKAFQRGVLTRERYYLRHELRQSIRQQFGLFSAFNYLDTAEQASWEVGDETPQDEVARYAAAWQAERDSVSALSS